jgi:ribosomal protein S18 acetylase RimI-like enzyme
MGNAITIRPFRETDAEAIVELYARAAAVEPRLGPITLPQWQDFIRLPQNRGGRDFRVAEQGGRLVGLAESSLREQGAMRFRFLKIVVAPEARRRRIGMALFDDVLGIDGADDDIAVQTLVSRDGQAGMGFVLPSALPISVRNQHEVRGAARAGPHLAAARWRELAGDVRHATPVARIHNAAYASDTASRRYSPEEMMQVLNGGELWIASEDGQASGFCLAEPEQNSMWIESVAVEPARQGRGLGQALVYRVLTAHGVSTEHPCWLNVSSRNAAALKIYRRLGFRPQHESCRLTATRRELIALRERLR